MSNHPIIGSFEWAKQIAGEPATGSPSLMEHVPRSLERAALDIAIKALKEVVAHDGDYKSRLGAREALARIAGALPERLHDIHGERERNTDRRP